MKMLQPGILFSPSTSFPQVPGEPTLLSCTSTVSEQARELSKQTPCISHASVSKSFNSLCMHNIVFTDN